MSAPVNRDEPRTEAGRAVASQWPFTRGEQTCCPYPHGEDSGPDVEPFHARVHVITTNASPILAIEVEARAAERAALLAELRAKVEGLPRHRLLGYDRVRIDYILALLSEDPA